MPIFLLTACGIKKKKILLELSQGMTKCSVENKIGKPDEKHCPYIAKNGDVVDIWEYKLAEVDEMKFNRRMSLQISGWFLFWPLLFFPQAWEDPYTYQMYFLEFINNVLTRWGKSCDLIRNSERI